MLSVPERTRDDGACKWHTICRSACLVLGPSCALDRLEHTENRPCQCEHVRPEHVRPAVLQDLSRDSRGCKAAACTGLSSPYWPAHLEHRQPCEASVLSCAAQTGSTESPAASPTHAAHIQNPCHEGGVCSNQAGALWLCATHIMSAQKLPSRSTITCQHAMSAPPSERAPCGPSAPACAAWAAGWSA